VKGHEKSLGHPFAVSMGNPHMVFITTDKIEKLDMEEIGAPLLERHNLFPERVNVGFAQIVDRDNINLRVFERGAGETLACGTGACAAAVAAISRGLCNRKINIKTRSGGYMVIEWRESDGHVIMAGPADFEGQITIDI
jgi:diaminopimelate epimerase